MNPRRIYGQCGDVLRTNKNNRNKATRKAPFIFCIYSHSLPHWRKPLPYSILHTRATWRAHNNVCTREPNSTFSSKKYFHFFFFENLFPWVWKVGKLFFLFTHSVYVDLLIQGNDNNKTISESGPAYRSSLSCVTTKLLDSIKLRSQLGLILWKCGIYAVSKERGKKGATNTMEHSAMPESYSPILELKRHVQKEVKKKWKFVWRCACTE